MIKKAVPQDTNI